MWFSIWSSLIVITDEGRNPETGWLRSYLVYIYIYIYTQIQVMMSESQQRARCPKTGQMATNALHGVSCQWQSSGASLFK